MQKQDGTANQQAGRDIINYHNEAQKPSSSSLEITNVRYKGSQMDFLLRNLGDVDLIIHEIKLTNTLPKPKPGSCPPATPGAGGILMPSAKYEVDADSYKVDANSINEGESKAINVSHVIPAHSADRILIAINLYCGSKFKIEFKYNKDQIASFTESNER